MTLVQQQKVETTIKHGAKDRQQEKVKTGIPGMDDLVEGGLVQCSSILLRGEAGSGKTIFGLQFLKNGALAGEPGVFLSVEEEKKDLLRESARFGWNLEALQNRGMLEVVEQQAQYALTIDLLRSTVERLGAKRVVIDSIPSLFSNYPNELRSSEWRSSFRLLCKLLTEECGCTAILITEAGWVQGNDFEEYVTKGVIELQVKVMDGVMRRFLIVKKMREVRHSRRLHLYEITKDGFALFTSTVGRGG
ncbi:MAG TPA: ATPase domain-containing protein [Candidatus Bathyarchaeia archaeon]|nr:ATPase domain-containing protein [Candidatus Bathyarchaeia archaeon]